MREQRRESEGAPNLQALYAVRQRASLPAIRDSSEPTFTVIPAPSSHGPSAGNWKLGTLVRLPVQGAQAGETQTQHSSSLCFGAGPLSSWMCRVRMNLKSRMGTSSKGHCTTRFVSGTSPTGGPPVSFQDEHAAHPKLDLKREHPKCREVHLVPILSAENLMAVWVLSIQQHPRSQNNLS